MINNHDAIEHEKENSYCTQKTLSFKTISE